MIEQRLFDYLLKRLDEFELDEAITLESKLEDRLFEFLKNDDVMITRQVSKKQDRYDLICKRKNQTVCIELKIKIKIKDIEQFDRYMPKFRDGLIILCWQAPFSVRDIFINVRKQSPTPIELVELSKRYL